MTVIFCAGYTCCPTNHHLCGKSILTRCYNISEDVFPPDCSCSIPQVQSTGVVTSGYKEMCHSDYVWVNWRKKCLRRN